MESLSVEDRLYIMRIMVVGLNPEYSSEISYSGDLALTRRHLRSTNMGAALITRSILDIYGGAFVNYLNPGDISNLRQRFDIVVVALASHLGPTRDVSELVKFVKRLGLRAFFVSGGLDANFSGDRRLSPSMVELLKTCSESDQVLGVRGYASAQYLVRNGFRNVVAVGCPTMFSGDLVKIRRGFEGISGKDLGVPFHWSLLRIFGPEELSSLNLIGQDWTDECIFQPSGKGRRARSHVKSIKKKLDRVGTKLGQNDLKKVSSSKSAMMPDDFSSWVEAITSKKALLSGRVHASLLGLSVGLPTTLVPWDLRSKEIASYFSIPTLGERDKSGTLANELRELSFSAFNKKQPLLRKRWVDFNRMNGVPLSLPSWKATTDSGLGGFESQVYHEVEIMEFSLDRIRD